MGGKGDKGGDCRDMRGLWEEKVCVGCGVNRNGLCMWKIRNSGRVCRRDLDDIYDGRIKRNWSVVREKMKWYVRFRNGNGIEVVELKSGKGKKGIYNMEDMNR